MLRYVSAGELTIHPILLFVSGRSVRFSCRLFADMESLSLSEVLNLLLPWFNNSRPRARISVTTAADIAAVVVVVVVDVVVVVATVVGG